MQTRMQTRLTTAACAFLLSAGIAAAEPWALVDDPASFKPVTDRGEFIQIVSHLQRDSGLAAETRQALFDRLLSTSHDRSESHCKFNELARLLDGNRLGDVRPCAVVEAIDAARQINRLSLVADASRSHHCCKKSRLDVVGKGGIGDPL